MGTFSAGSMNLKYDCALLFVTFVWGFTFVMVKEALTFVSPSTFLFYRFLLSFLLLFLVSAKRLNVNVVKYGVLIGVALFCGYGFQTVGLQYTTPANAGFITGLSVVIVPFLSVVVLKKKPNRYAVVGVFCAVVGLALLSFQGLEMKYGDFLVLLCAFSFAVHIVLVGKYAPVYDPVALTTVQVGAVALFSSFWMRGGGLNGMVVEAIIFTALFATVAAFLIQNTAQRYVSPTRTAVIFAMEPVFAALSSFVLIHEAFTVRKVVGCLLILVGMLIAELRK